LVLPAFACGSNDAPPGAASSPASAAASSTSGTSTGAEGGFGASGATSGATGGGGGCGGAPPDACAWMNEISNAKCDVDPCPISFDAIVICNEFGFPAPPSIALTSDTTWLATSSDLGPDVFAIANGVETRQHDLDCDIRAPIIAAAPDGTVWIASDTTHEVASMFPGGATVSKRLGNDVWDETIVFDPSDRAAPITGLEVGSDAIARVWVQTMPPDGFSIGSPDVNDAWPLKPDATPGGVGAGARFTIGSDLGVIALADEAPQPSTFALHALVHGNDVSIGPVDVAPTAYAITDAPLPNAPPTSALFGVAILEGDAIHVLAEQDGASVEDVIELGLTPASCTAPEQLQACKGTCHEQSDGLDYGAFAIAWTDDGVFWLVYVITHFDQTVAYSLPSNGGVECLTQVVGDQSTATLHVVRAPLDGTPSHEVLTMPVERPDPFGSIAARAFASDLGIAMATGWIQGPNGVRVIRIETAKL
jgi:hypothetical protein